MILFVILSNLLYAQGEQPLTELISARIVAKTNIEIVINSPFHCRDLEGTLKYEKSGRAIFGPHFYTLNIIEHNHNPCRKTKRVKIVTPIPTNIKSPAKIVINNESKKSVTVHLRSR